MPEPSTTQLLYVPDWPAQLQSRLLVPWQKPKILALAGAVGDTVQVHEDQALDLIASTGIFEATGDALDQWGELVGEKRGPLPDTEYRPFILARMLCNRCQGTVPELLQIFDIITSENVGVFHEDNFPAGFYLMTVRNAFMSDASARRVARMMEDVRPAGRHMTLIEALVEGFGFEDDESAGGFDVGPFSRLIEVA